MVKYVIVATKFSPSQRVYWGMMTQPYSQWIWSSSESGVPVIYNSIEDAEQVASTFQIGPWLNEPLVIMLDEFHILQIMAV